MRVDINDPRDLHRVTGVFLDNVKVEYCVEADDVEGYVLVHEWQTGAKRRREGQVRIELRPET